MPAARAAVEGADQVAAFGVPDLDGLVVSRARRNPPAIRTPRQGPGSAGGTAEVQEIRRRIRVPDPDRAVLARRGDPSSVGAPGHGRQTVAVAFEDARVFRPVELPDAHD